MSPLDAIPDKDFVLRYKGRRQADQVRPAGAP